jgi:hypothetical protein
VALAAPALVSASITSDGAIIGDLANSTLPTANVQGTMHTLNVADVVVSDGPLPLAEYGFYLQADAAQKEALAAYFANKNWTDPAWNAQIGSEIEGTSPYFYLVSDGSGNYGLIDGLQKALGNSSAPLLIDDDYPLGTYTYNGTVELEAKAIALTVAGDRVAPTIDAVSPIVAEATSAAGADVTITAPMSHDAVDGDIEASCDRSTGIFPLGVTTVTCSRADAAGNIAAPSIFTVTVQDTTGPSITVPIMSDTEATGPDGTVISYIEPYANDAVDGTVPVLCDRNPGDTFAMGTTTVSCNATDSRGNVGYASFTVLVQDTTAPLIGIIGSNPASVPLHGTYADAGATALDNFDGDVTGLIITTNLVDTSAVGAYTVTYDVTDTHGNHAARSRAVNVIAPMTLTVYKHVINDNGGTKTAPDFLMAVSTSSTCENGGCGGAGAGSPYPFSENGTVLTFYSNPGMIDTYSVDEAAAAGYAKAIGDGCSGLVVNGDNRACTITNDDLAVSGNASGMSASGFSSIGASINGTEASESSTLGGVLPVVISDNGVPLLAFSYDFSKATLDFGKITITRGTGTDGAAYFTVDGISQGALAGAKTLYIYNASSAFTSVCIKDAEGIVGAGQIGSACNGNGETLVPCNGAATGAYACTNDNSTLTITGLLHSGVKQQNAVPAAPAPAAAPSPSSYNGGGNVGGSSYSIPSAPAPVQAQPEPAPPAPDAQPQQPSSPAPVPTPAPPVAQPVKKSAPAAPKAAIPGAAAPKADGNVLAGALFDSKGNLSLGVLAALAVASFVALAGAALIMWRKAKRG